jgi:hypothetical protein
MGVFAFPVRDAHVYKRRVTVPEEFVQEKILCVVKGQVGTSLVSLAYEALYSPGLPIALVGHPWTNSKAAGANSFQFPVLWPSGVRTATHFLFERMGAPGRVPTGNFLVLFFFSFSFFSSFNLFHSLGSNQLCICTHRASPGTIDPARTPKCSGMHPALKGNIIFWQTMMSVETGCRFGE